MKSIRQTVQLASAQKLIAGARIVRARRMMEQSRPYHDRIRQTIASILGDCEYRGVYLDSGKPVRKRGLLVLSADRGLAGGYNQNVMKLAQQALSEQPTQTLLVVGNVGYSKFLASGAPMDRDFVYAAENPTVYAAREMAERLMAMAERGEVDCLDVCYTQYLSAVRMTPVVERLFPLSPEAFGESVQRFAAYEPSPEAVLETLIPKYLKGFLYGCLVSAWMCELNARVTAMDSAIRNGGEMLQRLGLQYNRARQAAITQEITEIVAGAATIDN
jgi:F-type H+-transporting ATPase subunit gamma